MLIVILIFCCILSIVFYLSRKPVLLPKTPREIIPELSKMKLIYSDDNNRRFFSSNKYKIRAKPDFIYELNNEIILVEFKSRQGPVWPGDIAQFIATAIAVKEKHPNLSRGYIYTARGDKQIIDLSAPIEKLFALIAREIEVVRSIKSKQNFHFTPSYKKCCKCYYNDVCTFSLAFRK